MGLFLWITLVNLSLLNLFTILSESLFISVLCYLFNAFHDLFLAALDAFPEFCILVSIQGIFMVDNYMVLFLEMLEGATSISIGLFANFLICCFELCEEFLW